MAKKGEKLKTRTDSKGQIELTIKEHPIYDASERLVLAKAKVMGAKNEMDGAEKAWVDEMKKINKSKINHKGDIIQFVRGKTTEDHARFCKT